MAPDPSVTIAGADIIFNRVNLALARQQGLLASLMGVCSADNLAKIAGPGVEDEEQDAFTAEPELLGMGAKIPKDDEVERQRLSSNDQLKRQLLGKDYDRKQKAKSGASLGKNAPSAPALGLHRKTPTRQPPQKVEVDSEDDAGRSSLGKLKRKRPQREANVAAKAATVEDEEEQALRTNVEQTNVKTKALGQKGGTFLDEILAERSAKRRKKRKKTKKNLGNYEDGK